MEGELSRRAELHIEPHERLNVHRGRVVAVDVRHADGAPARRWKAVVVRRHQADVGVSADVERVELVRRARRHADLGAPRLQTLIAGHRRRAKSGG